MVPDLMETCIDDVLRAHVAPPVTPEAYSTPSVSREDPLSLAEAAARLKQLELESSQLHSAQRYNINVNVAMNNQEDVVKLTEKCALSSSGSSPAATPLRLTEDLKSNILKAQAEAAALKGSLEEHAVVSGEKNCNVQEASVSGRHDIQDQWELIKSASVDSSAGAAASVERLAEDLAPPVPMMPSEFTSEALALAVKTEEVDPQTANPLSGNLIDFTDDTPVLPTAHQPKPVITPRWIIPTTTPPGMFTNGLLDLDPPAKVLPLLPADGGATLTSAPPPPAPARFVISNSSAGQQPASDDGAKPRGLLTTEL